MMPQMVFLKKKWFEFGVCKGYNDVDEWDADYIDDGNIHINDGNNGYANTDNIVDDGKNDIDNNDEGDVNHVNIDDKKTLTHLLLFAMLRWFLDFMLCTCQKISLVSPFGYVPSKYMLCGICSGRQRRSPYINVIFCSWLFLLDNWISGKRKLADKISLFLLTKNDFIIGHDYECDGFLVGEIKRWIIQVLIRWSLL